MTEAHRWHLEPIEIVNSYDQERPMHTGPIYGREIRPNQGSLRSDSQQVSSNVTYGAKNPPQMTAYKAY